MWVEDRGKGSNESTLGMRERERVEQMYPRRVRGLFLVIMQKQESERTVFTLWTGKEEGEREKKGERKRKRWREREAVFNFVSIH